LPDVVVRDEVDFGRAVADERLGLPRATVLVIGAGSSVRPAVVAEPLQALRAEHGLPADPDLDMLWRHLVLSPFPPSLRDPAFPLPPTARSFRREPRYREAAGRIRDEIVALPNPAAAVPPLEQLGGCVRAP
jgi:hypothetical protein